jgi:hypothetical protein
MAFNVKAPGGVCDSASEPTTCDLPLGTKFTLSVEVIDPPVGGYFGVQTEIYYGGLQYIPTLFAASEVVWPDASGTGRSPGTPYGNEGLVQHVGTTALQNPPVSNYSGNVVRISLRCPTTEATTELALPSFDDVIRPSGTSVRIPPNDGLAPKTVGQRTLPSIGTVDVTDVLEVNCLEALSTYTPTPNGPTFTPTPAPSLPEGDPGMDLNITAGGVCDLPAKPLKCSVLAGESFTLSVVANDRPFLGYIGVQVRLGRGALTYKATPSLIDEWVWPDCALPVRLAPATGGDLTFACPTELLPPFPTSTYEGTLMDIQLTCPPAVGSHTIDLQPYSASQTTGAGYKPPSMLDPVIPASDALSINCVTSLPVTVTPTAVSPVGTPASVGGIGHYPNADGGAGGSSVWIATIAGGAAFFGGVAVARLVWVRRSRPIQLRG